MSRAPFVSAGSIYIDAKSIACVMIRHVPDVVRMHYSKMIQYGVAKRRFCFFNRTYRRWISISSFDFFSIIKPEVTEIHPSRPRAHNLTSEVVSTRLEVTSYDWCFRAYLVRQYHQQQGTGTLNFGRRHIISGCRLHVRKKNIHSYIRSKLNKQICNINMNDLSLTEHDIN